MQHTGHRHSRTAAWCSRRIAKLMPAYLHFRAVVVGDEMYGSSPSLFRMVAQQYVCAGNDHEGFGGVTEAAENSTQSSEQD